MPDLINKFNNTTAGSVLKSTDISDVVITVADFSEIESLPVGFLINRTVIEGMKAVRQYDADGVTFTDSPYVDSDYAQSVAADAVNDGMDSILAPEPGGEGYLKWYEEYAGTQGYGENHGQTHTITYFPPTYNEWSVPDHQLMGPFVAIHHGNGTRTCFLMIHESAINDITMRDMSGENSVALRFVNQNLCLGNWQQTTPEGAIWNCQGAGIRAGTDPNATGDDASYIDIVVTVSGHGVVPHEWLYNSEEHVGHEFEGQLFVRIDSGNGPEWVNIDTVESTVTLVDVDTVDQAISGVYASGIDNSNVGGITFTRGEYYYEANEIAILIRHLFSSEWFIGSCNIGSGTFSVRKLFACYAHRWDIYAFLVPYYTAADAVGAEIEQLQECCEINGQEIIQLDAKVESIDVRVTDLEESTAVDDLSAEVAANASAIGSNTTAISANASAIDDSEYTIGLHTSAIVGNTAKIEQNSDAIDDLSAYSMQRTPNTGSVDSEKPWQGQERKILDVAGLTLSTLGNSGNYTDIVQQFGLARYRMFDGDSGTHQFRIGNKSYSSFDIWNNGQICTIDEEGIDLYGRTFRNVTGIQHDGAHDFSLNHGKHIKLKGPDDTGHGFRMLNDADNNTLWQKQKNNGDWLNFLVLKSGSYGDAELCPDTLSLLGMPHFVTHRSGASVIFANADNETGSTTDGVIYWENKPDYIQLSGVTKKPGTNQYSEKHLAIKIGKSGDVEVPQLKETQSMRDVSDGRAFRRHCAILEEFGPGSSYFVNI